jgi:hypothetical protein
MGQNRRNPIGWACQFSRACRVDGFWAVVISLAYRSLLSKVYFTFPRLIALYVFKVGNILRFRGGQYFTFCQSSIFYVSSAEYISRCQARGIFHGLQVGNILRFTSKVYSTPCRSTIFYVSTVGNILRFQGRVYPTVCKWGIFYASGVANILRFAGRVYFMFCKWAIFYGSTVRYILRF